MFYLSLILSLCMIWKRPNTTYHQAISSLPHHHCPRISHRPRRIFVVIADAPLATYLPLLLHEWLNPQAKLLSFCVLRIQLLFPLNLLRILKILILFDMIFLLDFGCIWLSLFSQKSDVLALTLLHSKNPTPFSIKSPPNSQNSHLVWYDFFIRFWVYLVPFIFTKKWFFKITFIETIYFNFYSKAERKL